MFSQKSIRFKFILQLVATTAALIGVLSSILYYFIKNSIYLSIMDNMEKEASSIALVQKNFQANTKQNYMFGEKYNISIQQFTEKKPLKSFETTRQKDTNFLSLYWPLKQNPSYFIVIKQDITYVKNLLNRISKNILMVNIFALIAVVFFSFFLSRIILIPIKTLGSKLAKMNEKYLNYVDTNNMPLEFTPLAQSLNRLIDRVQTFIKYRTELFVGVAHELKTPLAVMKTKNEVTLLKPRDIEYYKEAIQKNIDSIDEMNNMISAILKIGRQEGAQLEPPMVVDLVTFVKEKATNFQILAKQDEKNIKLSIRPDAFPTLTQPTLVLHILQNFVQNAIKFSPKNGVVIIQTNGNDEGFLIEVLDEGCGIKDGFDIYAPFKRSGEKSGVGLGLFLAKGAAQALNAQISVTNRHDQSGVIATLFIPRAKPI